MNQSIPRSDLLCGPRRAEGAVAPQTIAQSWSRTRMLKQVCHVVQEVSRWSGVDIAPDRNGLCLTLGGVILGHLRWGGRLDLPFAADVGERLLEEEMVQRDPEHLESTRVTFVVRDLADADRAVWLLRLAYLSVDAGDLPPACPCRL